ncbi:MAG: hypothetical protein KJT03_24280, partial [Verrucomicrobiae bacterium]|nr:hypothetical protein [Verrucomicrobiae bacterium]
MIRKHYPIVPSLVCFWLLFMAYPVFANDPRFLLSDEGSGRATAYVESPKIIRFENRVHVAWLDTPKEGFRI